MYIISQVFAGIGLITTTTGRLFKEQEKNLLFNIITNVMFTLSYFFLGAYVGMIGIVVSIIRSVVFYIFVKKKWEKKVWLLVLFIILFLVSCGLSSLLSREFVVLNFILVVLKGISFTYGSWQHNIKVFRLCSIIACSLSVVHDALVHGWLNMSAEALSIVFMIFVIFKERAEAKREELNSEKQESEDLNKSE